MISIKIKIPKNLEQKLKYTETALNKNVSSAIKKAAYLVHAETVKGIQRGSKTGRFYKRRSIEHQASAVGEYPASDTGRLANSFNVHAVNLYATVETHLIYAKYLVDKGRLLLEESLARNETKIQELIDAAIEKSLEE